MSNEYICKSCLSAYRGLLNISQLNLNHSQIHYQHYSKISKADKNFNPTLDTPLHNGTHLQILQNVQVFKF